MIVKRYSILQKYNLYINIFKYDLHKNSFIDNHYYSFVYFYTSHSRFNNVFSNSDKFFWLFKSVLFFIRDYLKLGKKILVFSSILLYSVKKKNIYFLSDWIPGLISNWNSIKWHCFKINSPVFYKKPEMLIFLNVNNNFLFKEVLGHNSLTSYNILFNTNYIKLLTSDHMLLGNWSNFSLNFFYLKLLFYLEKCSKFYFFE